MQPYFMPYIGYFQLVNAVDTFIFYDDVNFIRRGWINRNTILVNNDAYLFSIPLSKASQNSKIQDVLINLNSFSEWKKNFFRTLEFNYKNAPYYENTKKLLQNILSDSTTHISQLACKSIVEISRYLGCKTEFKISSSLNIAPNLKASDRILNICTKTNAKTYINPIGGQELYSKNIFLQQGINLLFIKSSASTYKQFSNNFIPNLSIIDVLMFNSPAEVSTLLSNYKLI